MQEYSKTYKPFKYPWAVELAQEHEKMHWIEQEIDLSEDVKDWQYKLTHEEKNHITQILRLFTQQDLAVGQFYYEELIPVFKNNEIRNMLGSFACRETIHQRAYALLNDTLGLPESEYHAFLEYEEMSDKYDWMLDVSTATNQDIALALIRSVFNEGVSLFASFAMLLNYQRSGICPLTGEDCGDAVMKGMNVVVEWSIADESVHVLGVSRLFREFCNEHPEVVDNYLIGKAWEMAFRIVQLEDRFIDLAYELGPIKGLSKDQVKQYMRYITDRRLIQLGIEPGFKVKDNPIPWLDWIISGTDHSNFFEKRVTEYSQAGMEGEWGWDASN